MIFEDLKYSEKIAIAKIFFRENYHKGKDLYFKPNNIYISWGKVEFYGKAYGCITVKTEQVKNFFENNNKIIRKEKLLEIKKNLL